MSLTREQVVEISEACKRAMEQSPKAPFVFGTRRIPGSRKRTSLRFADGNQGPKGKVVAFDPKTATYTAVFHAVHVLKWLADEGRIKVTFKEKEPPSGNP